MGVVNKMEEGKMEEGPSLCLTPYLIFLDFNAVINYDLYIQIVQRDRIGEKGELIHISTKTKSHYEIPIRKKRKGIILFVDHYIRMKR